MDESPQDMADFVEYVNGPADSPWGKRRAADGHDRAVSPEIPELGNEEAVNEDYWRRFKPLAEAIWAKDPANRPGRGRFPLQSAYRGPIPLLAGAPNIRTLAAHNKILDLAARAWPGGMV